MRNPYATPEQVQLPKRDEVERVLAKMIQASISQGRRPQMTGEALAADADDKRRLALLAATRDEDESGVIRAGRDTR